MSPRARALNRRKFIRYAAATLAAGRLQASERLPIRKAVLYSMLPEALTITGRFQLARETGFEEMECPTTGDPTTAKEILRASEKTGVRVHSVMNQVHWRYPLSSADPEVVAKGMAGMETSLRNANFWGADTVLLVPAEVNAETSYRDAWTRSQAQIRKLIPMAEKLKVIIAIEEVWNKFLLSPLEFARYIDEFQSPWVRAYFDIGNVVLTGYPQDWIRTLGPRIVKLHLKDFTFRTDPAIHKRVVDWVMLREGEVDWKAVYSALAEIKFHGTATVELAEGDEAYLRDVSRRVDLILSGV